jgi:hypothetical protein
VWTDDLGQVHAEQELSKILVESSTPVDDQTIVSHDLSPVQVQRSWDRDAEENVTDRMERVGLLAPAGEVDKVLETVVNNLEVTNDLDIQPEIRCRVLMTVDARIIHDRPHDRSESRTGRTPLKLAHQCVDKSRL